MTSVESGQPIDKLVADMLKIPESAKLIEALRSGHLCIEGEIPGGVKLKGEEKDFDGSIGNWDGLAYLHRCWRMEVRIAEEFLRLVRTSHTAARGSSSFGDASGLLNAGQKEAVEKGLVTVGPFFLTGGPGTGKTHTVAELVRRSGLSAKDIILTAPTGKAVLELQKRLKGIRALTLHKLLGIKGPHDPLWNMMQLCAKMVVVDECSMIDAGMWGALLSAVSEDMRLVLVGDRDQLPPVEAGTVYEELASWSEKHLPMRYVCLTECMRTDKGSAISEMAEAVKKGETIPVTPLCRFHVQNFSHLYKQGSFRILSCLKEGYYGVRAINMRMEKVVDKTDRVPVMAMRSDYRYGICNGETGTFVGKVACGGMRGEGDCFFQDRKIPSILLPHIEPAYAVSVHKSQGSEYDRVVLVVPQGSEVFGKEILYTGITRARMQIEVYGESETVALCLQKSAKRMSGLFRRLSCRACA